METKLTPQELYDEISSLIDDDRLIEQNEPACMGMELGNMYSELNDAVIHVKLHEETFDDSNFSRNNFTLDMSIPTTGLTINSDGDIHYITDDSIKIDLKFNSSFSTDRTMGLTIAADELSGSSNMTNILPDIYIFAIIEPVITDVIIDDVAMGIGSTV